jgi:hypothetical protein
MRITRTSPIPKWPLQATAEPFHQYMPNAKDYPGKNPLHMEEPVWVGKNFTGGLSRLSG